MIYILIFVVLSILSALSARNPAVGRFALLVSTVFLFVFIGFREKIGCDWSGYQEIYKQTSGLSVKDVVHGRAGNLNRETGFVLLNVFLHYLKLPYFWVNVVASLFFMWGLTRFALRQPNPVAIVALSFPIF